MKDYTEYELKIHVSDDAEYRDKLILGLVMSGYAVYWREDENEVYVENIPSDDLREL